MESGNKPSPGNAAPGTPGHSDEDWLLQHVHFIKGSAPGELRILDLGCGPGRDALHLVKLGHVTAADANQQRLAECALRAPAAQVLRLDISRPLPFKSASFDFILASLSLHYFSWNNTVNIAAELRRCLSSAGRSIVRLNSTNDTNYGANSRDEIEPNYYRVGSANKRFFDLAAVQQLFQDWHIHSASEKQINRYEKTKVVWEVLLHAP